MKRQILLSLCLLTIYCVAPVFAQENSANKEKLIAEFVKLKKTLVPYAENQCEAYGKKDFIGSEINLSVKDADIRDVLKYVTEDFGCTFVFDSSVGKTSITVNICNVPWNIALDSVLKSENLAIENRNSILRVINSEYTYETNWSGSSLSKEPLYTGFVKLKNLKLNWQMPPCFGRSMSDFDLDEFKNSKKFIRMIQTLLTRKGAVEVENRSVTLIITDEESRVKLISDFVKLLDGSGFTLEELVSDLNLEIK